MSLGGSQCLPVRVLLPQQHVTDLTWADGVETDLVAGAESAAAKLAAAQHSGATPALIVHDDLGFVVAASEAAADLLGLSWDELADRNSRDRHWSAVSEDGLPLANGEQPPIRAVQTGDAVDGFLMGVLLTTGRHAGRTLWLSASSHPVGVPPIGVVTAFADVSDSARGQDADRKLHFSTIHDTTERERVDIELRHAAAIFGNTLDAVIITDAGGTVQRVNPAFTRLTGWDPTWVTGLSAQVLGSSATKIGSFDRIRDAIEEGGSFRGEFSVLHADASESPALLSISPIQDATGEVSSFAWILADISDRVRAEREIARSEQQYRLLAENASDVVLQVDADSVIRWASPSVESVLGWSPLRITGTKVTDLDHPADRERAKQWRAELATS
ncbi:MAG: PAS domain S-box protein, partial [Actinomycetes bacterium]